MNSDSPQNTIGSSGEPTSIGQQNDRPVRANERGVILALERMAFSYGFGVVSMRLAVTKHGRHSVRVFLWLTMAAITAVGACSGDSPPNSGKSYFRVEPGKGLSADDRAVEDRFSETIAENINVFVAAYRWKWPKVINTDNARELCQQYAPDGFEVMTDKNKEHRTRFALGTQAPARALAMEVYRQMLKEAPKGNEEPLVVFTAGGAGSGKSTSVAAVLQMQNTIERAQIIFDTTLSSTISLDQVQMALDAGKAVKIFYIYRDPELAFQGVLERATLTGRPVTISNFIDTHLGAPSALDNVARRFSKDIVSGAVEVQVVDNTGSMGTATLAKDGALFVRAKTAKYSADGLRKQLHDLLKEAYDNDVISEDLFNKMDQ